jgi:hypothetical protein
MLFSLQMLFSIRGTFVTSRHVDNIVDGIDAVKRALFSYLLILKRRSLVEQNIKQTVVHAV